MCVCGGGGCLRPLGSLASGVSVWGVGVSVQGSGLCSGRGVGVSVHVVFCPGGSVRQEVTSYRDP